MAKGKAVRTATIRQMDRAENAEASRYTLRTRAAISS
jgi:hypothetical protein